MYAAFLVALVLVGVSVIGTTLHLLERYACEALCSKNWRICKWAHFAIERIYYLRTEHGLMLYVGQTVNEQRRWEQHQAEGRHKENWKYAVDIGRASSVVRYCWTKDQSLRVERRRTLAIYAAFALWDAIGIEELPRQIHNISNTPRDARRPVKAHEWALALCFLPFYAIEGWMIPEAQWATPVDPESFSGHP